MKKHNILFLELLFLPQCRKRSFKLLEAQIQKAPNSVIVPLMQEHIDTVEKLTGVKFPEYQECASCTGRPAGVDPCDLCKSKLLEVKASIRELNLFMLRHKRDHMQRLAAMMIRAGELRGGKIVE